MKGRQILAAVLTGGMLAATSCEYVQQHETAQGALIGTAAGAGLGAIAGEAASGDAGRGAVWGAAAGALVGTGVGYLMEKQRNDLQRRMPAAQVTEEVVENPQYAPEGTKALSVTMESKVLFAFDSDSLQPGALQPLSELAGFLTDPNYPRPQRVTVIGHTDSVGDRVYNKDLSERRANTVANFLVSRGVDPGLLVPVGMGPDDPKADNSTEYGRMMNRRVEILIVPGK